jgi:hypothetical protein
MNKYGKGKRNQMLQQREKVIEVKENELIKENGTTDKGKI